MTCKFAASGLLGVAMLAHATPINLVANGGFETGDFTNWSIAAATCGSDFGVSNNPIYAHSGNNAAFFAGTCVGSYDSFQQTIATSPGQAYTVSFWIETKSKPDFATRDLQVFWNGNPILDLSGAGAGTYVEYTFNEQGIGSKTILEFQGYNQPNSDYVDDVSVVGSGVVASEAVAEPSAGILLFVGLGLLLARRLFPFTKVT